MRTIVQVISWLTLVFGIVLPPCLYYIDKVGLDALKLWMLIATVVWFVVTPMWMGRAPEKQAPAAEA